MSWLKKILKVFSYQEKLVFMAAGFLAVFSSLILAGIIFRQTTRAVPARGGDYVEGLIGQPSQINPVLAGNEVDKSLVRLIFSSLNDLADKINVKKDGKLWNVRLKENIFWSDGQKLTSDDVIFTVQKIRDSDTQSPLFLSWQGVAANRLSELEIQFVLPTAYAFFADNLKSLYILPKHLFADIPAANWRLSEYNLKPVASGPYEFSSYETRSDGFIKTYRLKANRRYFKDQPLIQNFDFQFFPNADEMIKAFNAGQIDGLAGLTPGEIKEISRSYEIFSFSLPSYYAVFFNQNKDIALQDASVRQALSLAVDRQELIDKILNGKGVAADGPLVLTTPSTSSLALADKILDNNGWKMNDSGFRVKKIKGVDINLELALTTPQLPFLSETADWLQDRWQKIGVKVNIADFSPETIVNDIIKNRDYQAILFGNSLNPAADLFPFWHSSERFYPGLNLALYNNKKADQLIEAVRRNFDSQSRQEQLNQLQTIIANDYPAVFLYSPDYLYVSRRDLGGLESGFITEPADRLLNASRWYLMTARVLK